MTNVSLNAAVRQSLSAIQQTSSQAQVQQLRLATGKKVNSALDNPTNFFISEGLNSRANDLGRLLDSIGQATKAVEAADKGIRGLTKLVETAQGAARQALQSGASNLASTGSALVGGAAKTAIAADAGNLVVNIGGSTQTFAVATGDTVQKLVDTVNASNSGLRASVGADNKLTITAGGGESLEIAAATTDATATFLGLTEGTVARTAANSNAVRTSLADQFNSLRTQVDQLARDSSYNGVNLLASDNLRVQFNEQNTSSISIKGVNFDSTGLAIKTAANNFQADSDINAALADLDKAITTLRSQASTFGANLSVVQNRQDFTRGLIDTLRNGSDALVLADTNEDGAKLATLNTRQQLATTALALASQSDQNVLRLF
jgi:flagellin-like hook-associated protein FlgL